MNREYRIEDLTEEEAAYIGRKINEIVPCEVDTDEEEFVLKVENESGEIVGGCIAEAYDYHWSRMFLNTLFSFFCQPFNSGHFHRISEIT